MERVFNPEKQGEIRWSTEDFCYYIKALSHNVKSDKLCFESDHTPDVIDPGKSINETLAYMRKMSLGSGLELRVK